MISIKKERNPLVLPIGIIITLQVIIVIFLIQLLSQLKTLSGSYRTVMVDDITGSAFNIVPFASTTQRHPDQITRFTTELLHTAFNTDKSRENTESVAVETSQGKAQITHHAFAAGFMVAPSFRSAFLEKIALLTPKEILSGQYQSVLEISKVSAPQQEQEGVWSIDIAAVRILYNGKTPVHQQPIQWRLFIQATSAPVVPKGNSPLAELIYHMRQTGLEVSAIQNQQWENLEQ